MHSDDGILNNSVINKCCKNILIAFTTVAKQLYLLYVHCGHTSKGCGTMILPAHEVFQTEQTRSGCQSSTMFLVCIH